MGVCKLTVPLAANDPAGKWRVIVRELLSDKEAETTFTYRPSKQCGALAGSHAARHFLRQRLGKRLPFLPPASPGDHRERHRRRMKPRRPTAWRKR